MTRRELLAAAVAAPVAAAVTRAAPQEFEVGQSIGWLDIEPIGPRFVCTGVDLERGLITLEERD